MRRRAVLCALGGTGSLALAGCLDLDLNLWSDDDTGGVVPAEATTTVDSVQAGERRQLLIAPANPLPLSGVEGAVVVTIELHRAPNAGEFSLTLAPRTGNGETVTELDGTYRIDESL